MSDNQDLDWVLVALIVVMIICVPWSWFVDFVGIDIPVSTILIHEFVVFLIAIFPLLFLKLYAAYKIFKIEREKYETMYGR